MSLINDGFVPKRQTSNRLPPGQYETKDFPVLSLGPTPDIDLEKWSLRIDGLVATEQHFSWLEFKNLPHEAVRRDIHCVTKWSKFDSDWSGVSLDFLLKRAGVIDERGNVLTTATHIIAHSYDGYTTNLPLEDVLSGKAWVATAFEDEPITAEHGGPARLLVPHLYFWKSAKWLNRLELVDADKPGFWEVRGYHNYGDPWREQRYTFDE